jgi:hypothetical protein
MKNETSAPSDKRHRFPPEIIAHAVWRVLSGKVEMPEPPENRGMLRGGGVARQAIAGAAVTARQVAKRSSRVSR